MPLERAKPLQVVVSEFKTFDAAVKKFKKKVDKDGILKQCRERQSFKSKSKKKYDKRRKMEYIRRTYGGTGA
jgi:ribosomal protein S21